MSILRVLGWGLMVYSITQLMWRFLLVYDIAGVTGTTLLVLALTGTSVVATIHSPLSSLGQLAKLVFGLLLVVFTLDSIFYLPANGPVFFADPKLWIGYFLLIMPPCVVTVYRVSRTLYQT